MGSEESNILKKAKEQQIDALYEKKKHFNAADRKEKYHSYIGVSAFIINIIVSAMLIAASLNFIIVLQSNWAKWIAAVLSSIAAILVGIQTYFNFRRQVNGHRETAAKFLALGKEYGRLIAAYKDKTFDSKELYEKLEKLSKKHERIIQDGNAFSTNSADYLKAQKGFQAGEEGYTDKEKQSG